MGNKKPHTVPVYYQYGERERKEAKAMEKWRFNIRKKEYPMYCENGGGITTDIGRAEIVCDVKGKPKVPIFIKKGNVAFGLHVLALFLVNPNDVIINVKRDYDDYRIRVYQIQGFKEEKGNIIGNVNCIATFEYGVWDNEEIGKRYKRAIETAKAKSRCCHCHYPFYVKRITR